jgi:hypothetical protein
VLAVIAGVVLLTITLSTGCITVACAAPRMGLRLSPADAADAGHGRGLRQPIRQVFEAVLPIEPPAVAVR